MATDARILTGLPRHPKMQKLIRRLGQGAAWNWVCLVLWAAESRTDGDLDGLSDEDVELAADWDGEPGLLVATLVSVRFLDGAEGSYQLHDWADHNPWAMGAEKRSLKAKWNAAKRHHGIDEADRVVPEYAAIRTKVDADSKDSDATSKPLAQVSDARSSKNDAPSPSPSPSPSPYPTPTLKKTKPPAKADEPPGFTEFWGVWPKHDRKGARGECLKAWLKAGAEGTTAAVIAHVERMKRTPGWTKDGGQFVPAPTTYLNQRRWDGAEDGDAGAWWLRAGFTDRYEADNARCTASNAHQFRDGKRTTEAA